MLKGKIVFLKANLGSKSEGEFPYIQLENGENVKIFVESDNPFENDVLSDYEGKTVEAEGEFNENGTFIATELKEIVPEEAPEEKNVDSEEAPEAEKAEEPCETVEENKEKTDETEAKSVEIEENTEE